MANTANHRVVVVGGGFGGLYAAKGLKRAPVDVTLVDRRNFHLFQPLLYQVATGGLSPGDIASPLRHALKRQQNVQVLLGEVVGIEPRTRRLALTDGELSYDTLILAGGVGNHYFGNDSWQRWAPGLKELEDALQIRRRVLAAFEAAERDPAVDSRAAWHTFVVVGGGPTGVELAGALGELAHRTLPGEFRRADPRHSRVILIEAGGRILSSFPSELSARAQASLRKLGVEVQCGSTVTGIDAAGVDLETGGGAVRIATRTVIWAAGVRAAPLAAILSDATGCAIDPMGRIVVEPDLTVPGFPQVFVVGDMAHVPFQGTPLPCIAPAAIQQGKFAARVIRTRLAGGSPPRVFQYLDKGSLATIGRSAAVAEFRGLRFWGFPAWLVWLVIHLIYLIGFENRLLVLIQWVNMYARSSRGSRLITDGEAG